MINCSYDLMIIKESNELSNSVVTAISQAKQCVQDEIFEGEKIAVNKISTGSKNPLKRASIFKFFQNHDDPSKAPIYDEQWVKKLFLCATTTKESNSTIAALIPDREEGFSWINKTYRTRFWLDALLVLHCLWVQKAVLLPLGVKLPTTLDPITGGNTLEFAFNTYPETLAITREPFISTRQTDNPGISEFIPEKARDNFNWFYWRIIRASDWYTPEDISLQDANEISEQILSARRNQGAKFYKYPLTPKNLLIYFKKMIPERCNYSMNECHAAVRHVKAGISEQSVQNDQDIIPDAVMPIANKWFEFQNRYLKKRKAKVQSWEQDQKRLSHLNSYLFEIIPSIQGTDSVPMPCDFSRVHIEGYNGTPSLLEYLKEGRADTTYKTLLYSIADFFDYLQSSSTLDPALQGFVNPLLTLDFPHVPRGNSTTKVTFESEVFPSLLQYCYAIEAFGWYLSEKVHYEGMSLSSQAGGHVKVYDTESLGFTPVVFIQKPNKTTISCIPLHYIPKTLLSVLTRCSKSEKEDSYKLYPLITHIQHAIVALETGIRNIHIRWLDRRNYDKYIDRSTPLPPICELHVNTDKAHDAWGAKVSKNVIDVLDRQVQSHSWFNEPVMDEAIWYNGYVDGRFGKIATIFPKGMAGGAIKGQDPGPFAESTFTRYFKNLIFSFDLFLRFQLGMKTSSPMPEEIGSLSSLNNIDEWETALSLFDPKLIEQTPHSCRATVVSEYIKILPPDVIGNYITGHATVAHVLYYVKIDPAYILRHKGYQKIAIDNDIKWDESFIAQTKAEDMNSKLRKAIGKDRQKAASDFGAISFDKSNRDGKVSSGIKALNEQPLEALAFMPTHICPHNNQCPLEVVKDLGADPGRRMPCGGCYYSVKTVDHLPRIHGHIRSLVAECEELKDYIEEAKIEGASAESLKPKAAYRKFLSDEATSWSTTAFCLEQMYQDIKTRDHFLVEKPQIVRDRLELIAVDEDDKLETLMARIAEAKTHAEFFTPQLQKQVKAARNKLLAHTHDINRLMQDAPKGFSLLDEFRGLIRTACETLGVTVKELSHEMEKPLELPPQRFQSPLKLISNSRSDM